MESSSGVKPIRWTSGHLEALLSALSKDGYLIIGPTLQDGVIKLDSISSIADLPQGYTDDQGPGSYRIKKREDAAYFGYNLPPDSWRRWLDPSKRRVWSAERKGAEWCLEADREDLRKMAFIGMRACDLAALRIQNRVRDSFVATTDASGTILDQGSSTIIIGVQCGQSAAVCFCASMHTGPEITDGCDLMLSEVVHGDQDPHFIVWGRTKIGKKYADAVGGSEADSNDIASAEAGISVARSQQTRSIAIDDPASFFRQRLNSRYWDDIGRRCLGCACCTLVCPTCFCTNSFDITDLTMTKVERFVVWDSCFNKEFTLVHGAAKRDSVASRFRQWLSHKLGSWHEQFGSSGCVGCGRCITWCPVGIDITKEVAQLAQEAGS